MKTLTLSPNKPKFPEDESPEAEAQEALNAIIDSIDDARDAISQAIKAVQPLPLETSGLKHRLQTALNVLILASMEAYNTRDNPHLDQR